jgi:polyferredoxin
MKFFVIGIRTIFLLLFIYLIITGNMKWWFALFVLSLIITIFFGTIYCGYVCRMNALMNP